MDLTEKYFSSGFLLGRVFDHSAHPPLPDRERGLHDGLQTIGRKNFDLGRKNETAGNKEKVTTTTITKTIIITTTTTITVIITTTTTQVQQQ